MPKRVDQLLNEVVAEMVDKADEAEQAKENRDDSSCEDVIIERTND